LTKPFAPVESVIKIQRLIDVGISGHMKPLGLGFHILENFTFDFKG
jgi:hypothetical protein